MILSSTMSRTERNHNICNERARKDVEVHEFNINQLEEANTEKNRPQKCVGTLSNELHIDILYRTNQNWIVDRDTEPPASCFDEKSK